MSNKRSRHQSATVEKESPPQELGASSTSPPQSAAKRRRLGDRTRIATSRPSSTPSTLAATAASPSSSFVRDSSSLSIGSSSHGHSVAVIQGKMDKARRLKSVASEAHRDGRLEEAFLILSACIKLSHLDEALYLNRSLVAFDLHLFSRSLEDAQIALTCIRREEETRIDLEARLMSQSSGRGSTASGASTDNIVHRLEADHKREMDRLRAKAHLRAAEARARLGQLDQAAQDLEMAWLLRPDCPEIQQAQQQLIITSRASSTERQRWLRQQHPKKTIKESDDDDDGIFSRSEFDRAVAKYVDQDVV
ncbi:uncharacterized protein PSFLO_07078 [Pseudozyma flocculosa]|uniref:EF-hand domain-containing protein n=1 Tax=Pseudozyma flocculosa TaxID=84751 RepID=A0A5C3FBT7_9BASI|nr:uncharacterized protein PSFLO_07078 [Pseudozyma flocculosa]